MGAATIGATQPHYKSQRHKNESDDSKKNMYVQCHNIVYKID